MEIAGANSPLNYPPYTAVYTVAWYGVWLCYEYRCQDGDVSRSSEPLQLFTRSSLVVGPDAGGGIVNGSEGMGMGTP